MHNEFMGELLGTLFLVLFGGGVVANSLLHQSKGKDAGWISITAGWAVAVLIGVFVAQATGSVQADLNPAVTFAKYLLGNVYTLGDALLYSFAETLGAFLGAVLVWLVYFPHWKQESSPSKKLAVYCTAPAIRHIPGNLLTEIISTTALVMGVGAIVSQDITAKVDPSFVPYMVAMLVLGIGLSLGGPTGYAINPARDLGPRIAHAILPIHGKGTSDWQYAWIPVVGPMIGGAIGAFLWHMLF